MVNIESLGSGDAFGWSALLPDQDTLYQVSARERSAASRVDGPRVYAALRKDPVFVANMLWQTLDLVAERMQATEVRLGEMCGARVKRNEIRASFAIGTSVACNSSVG
jgi:CRP-like cAMP-binding protein